MATILIPCKVSWALSPSESLVTLRHTETEIEPACVVDFGAGRLQADDRTDSRRVEITFFGCYHARVGPHSDTTNIEVLGYQYAEGVYPEESRHDYLAWRARRWRSTGYCPDSGFWEAVESDWLSSLEAFYRSKGRHFVIDGRDGYVEVVAERFTWREWVGTPEHP